MKTGFAIALVAVVVALVAWFAGRTDSSRRLAALAAERDLLMVEKAALEQAQAGSRTTVETWQTTETASGSPSGPSASEILETLKSTRLPAGELAQIMAMRQVVFHLESLVRKGPVAPPPIRTYLAGFEDVDFLPESPVVMESIGVTIRALNDVAMRGMQIKELETRLAMLPPEKRERVRPPVVRRTNPDTGQNAVRDEAEMMEVARREMLATGAIQTEKVRFAHEFPPSLRVGLAEVLSKIGGPDAEAGLVEMIRGSAKAFEVAYVARLLDAMAPMKYRGVAVAAATEMIVNSRADGAKRLDQREMAYLYTIFDLCEDSSFMRHAQRLLVTEDGKLDPHALAFLADKTKEGSLVALYSAFNDPRLTNIYSKAVILDRSMKQVGRDSNANAMWVAIVGDETLPPVMRAMYVNGLLFGSGRDETQTVVDTIQAQGRMHLLQQVRKTVGDEGLANAIDRMLGRLEDNLKTTH